MTQPDWLNEPAKQPNETVREAALARQGQLTKPPGSLGRLEAVAVTLAALQGRERPALDRVRIVVFAADHGVAAEGVSAFPREVTVEMIRNFSRGGAAIAVLAREQGAALEVVDVGAAHDPGPLDGVVSARVAGGSANLRREPAMSEAQLAAALAAGRAAVERGGALDLFIGGEMGIANTTSATAVACSLTGESPLTLAGPGTGLDAEGVGRKVAVIADACGLHRAAEGDGWESLRRLGGFEIAALAGAYIRCAQRGVPVLVDGFIAGAAALAAVKINPSVAPWLLYAHASAEPGHAVMMDALEAQPLLDLGMRLGEGSGAAVALATLKMAVALHNGMATFAEAGVSDG